MPFFPLSLWKVSLTFPAFSVRKKIELADSPNPLQHQRGTVTRKGIEITVWISYWCVFPRCKSICGIYLPPAVRLQNSTRNGSCLFCCCCSLLPLLCQLLLFSLKGSRIGLEQQGPRQHQPFSSNFFSFPEKGQFPCFFRSLREQSNRGLPYRNTAAIQMRDTLKYKSLALHLACSHDTYFSIVFRKRLNTLFYHLQQAPALARIQN